MAEISKPTVTAGLVLGVLYIVFAVFTVPVELIWLVTAPFVCGFLALYLYGKKSPSALGAGSGAKLGAIAGGIGGLLVLIGAPLLYLILSAVAGDEMKEQMRRAEIDLPFYGFLELVVALVIESIIGAAIAAIGGLVAGLIFGRR